MSAEFNKAAEDVKKCKTQPNNDEMLTLYRFYKQATVGDCDTSRPGMLDLKGKAKWDSWNSIKGTMSKQEAEAAYIKFANDMIAKYGLNW